MLQSTKPFLTICFVFVTVLSIAQTNSNDQMQKASIQNSPNSIIQQNKNGNNSATINVKSIDYTVPVINFFPLNSVIFFDTFQGGERYKLLVWNGTNKVAYNVKGSVYMIYFTKDEKPYNGLNFNGIIDYTVFNSMMTVELFTSAKYEFVANLEFAVIIKGTYSYSAKGKLHEFTDIRVCNMMERKMMQVTDMHTKNKAYDYLAMHEDEFPKYNSEK